jgi:hypothetical protein
MQIPQMTPTVVHGQVFHIATLQSHIENAILIRHFGFYCSQNCLGFQSFNFEHTWWRLIQKSVVFRKFDIYVLVHLSYLIPKDVLGKI